MFGFADPENLTIYEKNFSISCTKLKSVQFWLTNLTIHAKKVPDLVDMATPLAPLKFLLPYLNLPTPKTLLFMRKIP